MRVYSNDEWTKVRGEGKRAFLLKNGFLGRGIPLGLLVSIGVEAYRGGQFPEALQTPEYWSLALMCVVVFTVSGCITANASWGLHEKRHGHS